MNDGCYELFLASFTFEVHLSAGLNIFFHFCSMFTALLLQYVTLCDLVLCHLFWAFWSVHVFITRAFYIDHVDVTSLCGTFASFVFQLGIYLSFFFWIKFVRICWKPEGCYLCINLYELTPICLQVDNL